MSISHIPEAHLRHLLQQAGLDPDEVMGPADISLATAAWQGAISRLDEVSPGSRSRLFWEWASHDSRAVFMWTLPCLRNIDQTGLAALLMTRFACHDPSGSDVAVVDGYSEGETGFRLVRVRAEADRVIGRAVHRMEFAHQDGDGLAEGYRTSTVPFEIDLRHNPPLGLVFSTASTSRQMVNWLLGRLVGIPVPSRGPKRDLFLKPIIFTEAKVDAIAQAEGWVNFYVAGPDPKNKLGESTYTSRKDGVRHEALPVDDDRIAGQLGVPNKGRAYRVSLRLQDGYEDSSEIDFHYKSVHPHITFRTKASRSLMNNVIDLLLAQLGLP